ncbi:MAG: single-stranded DNA-binding protein [Ruminococcus sp.]|nr:single-stranded DNA-binding protein [Ruminococcus sp.]
MINVTTILGRLTAEPELKTTQKGVNYVGFTVAVDRDGPSGAARVTDFIDCIAWEGTAKFITDWFSKGSMIAITGRLETNLWKDKNGNTRKTNTVNVTNASFTGERSKKLEANNRTAEKPPADFDGFPPFPPNPSDTGTPF